MEISNRTEKRIYDLIINEIKKGEIKYTNITNVEIGRILEISPITARDKVLKLIKQNHLTSLVNHFDENNKYFHRKLFKGETPG